MKPWLIIRPSHKNADSIYVASIKVFHHKIFVILTASTYLVFISAVYYCARLILVLILQERVGPYR